MKRKYGVVWEKETVFGRMIDIATYTANSYTEAVKIGYDKALNDRYGKVLNIITVDFEKNARKSWEYHYTKAFIETWGN